ncbi:ABC transporter permease [Candidatus Hydrogenedentota bacterium]
MLFTIIMKELRHNLLTLRFTIFFLLLFALIVGSTLTMGSKTASRMAAYERWRSERLEKLREMDSVWDLRWHGISTMKRPNMLSVFAGGLENLMSRRIQVALFQGIQLVGSGGAGNPVFSLFTRPDFLYVVNVVLSLIALLFTFDAVCGEFESGTLKLLMSNSVPRYTLILGKWIGGYLTLCIPLIMASLAALTALISLTAVTFTGEELLCGALLLGISLLYVSIFFALGMAISILTKQASTALMIALFSWVVLVLAIPNLAPVVAREMIELPSSSEIVGRRKAIDDKVYRTYRKNTTWSMPWQERVRIFDEFKEKGEREKQMLEMDYGKRVSFQGELAGILARISPSSSYVYAGTNIVGTGTTGLKAQKQFIYRFSEDYRKAVRRLEEKEFEKAKEGDYSEEPFDVRELPDDEFRGSPIARNIQESLPDIMLMAISNMALFMLAYVRFIRYSVI